MAIPWTLRFFAIVAFLIAFYLVASQLRVYRFPP
jgi:hypothetical protein